MSVPQIDFSPIGDLPNIYRQARLQSELDQAVNAATQGGGGLDLNRLALAYARGGNPNAAAHFAGQAQQQYLHSPEYITKAKTAEAQVAEQFAPKTTNLKLPGGDEVTVQKGTKGYEIPTIQGMPTQTAEAVPPGVDPKEYRKRLADAHVTNQEAAVKDAKAAADFQPIVDQAVAAYERAMKAGAIGPVMGSAPARFNETYNPLARNEMGGMNPLYADPERENARQDYDKAKAALQARITAAQNKGEGAVSNFERQMYAAQFPDLTMMDPAKGLQYLRQIQAQTKQTVGTGSIPALGQAPVVQNVLDRPSIPGGNQIPPTRQNTPAPQAQANPTAWRTKETVTAARANPQGALQEARTAIANGAPREAVIQRLKQVGVDPSGL
jgi:hypothetical protein